MSVGFGFSAGDFIAALELVHTVINALRESGNSSSEYRELISQLYTLETALIAVKNIELDDVQHSEVVALQQAASQCQRTIDTFWEKIQKYQSHLRSGGSGRRFKDGWMRMKWALCREEDLVKFKADLIGHTKSIEVLLITVQMGATRIDSRKNDKHHETLAGQVQSSYFGCMQKMRVVLERVSNGIQQGKEVLEMTAKIFQQNVQIFQIVLNMQNIIMRIPGQVERQQPVYFVDAIGRHMAFHLEFVLSAEALISVLRSNFKNIGPGARKIDKGEFAIQNSVTKKDINLSLPWDSCFTPGQHVDMSMVFISAKSSDKCCPKCRDDNGNDVTQDEDIECRKCKMVYRRSVSTVLNRDGNVATSRTPELRSWSLQPNRRKRQAAHDEDEEIAIFLRVRIRLSRRRSSRTSNFEPQPAVVQEADLGRNSDPYADPDLVRMLEDERNREAEMADAAVYTPFIRRTDPDVFYIDGLETPLVQDPEDPEAEFPYNYEIEYDRNLDPDEWMRQEYEADFDRNPEMEEALRRQELDRALESGSLAEAQAELEWEESEAHIGLEMEAELEDDFDKDDFDRNLEIEEALRRQELDRNAEAAILADAQAGIEWEDDVRALHEAQTELEREDELEEVLMRQHSENNFPDTEEESNLDDDEYDYEEMMIDDSGSD